jgi:hypothetical protein
MQSLKPNSILLTLSFATVFGSAASVTPVAVTTNRTSDILTDSVPTRIAVDSAHRSCIAGQGLDGRLTVALFAIDGTRLWVTSYSGPTNAPNDRPNAVAIGPSNEVYVAAASRGDGTMDDYLTLKIDTAGVLQWARRFNGASNGNDVPVAVATSLDGSAHVTGRSFLKPVVSQGYGTIEGTDFRTIKYAADGTELWSTNVASDLRNEPHALRIDYDGNIVIAGLRWSGDVRIPDISLRVVKYSPATGTSFWSFSGGGSLDSKTVVAMELDRSNNVYITSLRGFYGAFYPNAQIYKLSSSGSAIWGQDIPSSFNAYPFKVIASQSNLIVAGTTAKVGLPPVTTDMFVQSLRQSDGGSNWTVRWTLPGLDAPYVKDLWLNSRGDIYVSTSWQSSKLITLKYSPSGDLAWASELPMNFAGNQILGLDSNGYLTRTAQARFTGVGGVDHINWRFLPDPPFITSDSGGVVRGTLLTRPFATNQVEYGLTFTNWQALHIAVADAEGALSFTDTHATNSMRFYRAREQ